MINPIHERIIELRKGYYVHAIEVYNAHEIECIVESVINDFGDEFTEKEYIEFFNSMFLYCLDESQEDDIYSFDFEKFIKDTI